MSVMFASRACWQRLIHASAGLAYLISPRGDEGGEDEDVFVHALRMGSMMSVRMKSMGACRDRICFPLLLAFTSSSFSFWRRFLREFSSSLIVLSSPSLTLVYACSSSCVQALLVWRLFSLCSSSSSCLSGSFSARLFVMLSSSQSSSRFSSLRLKPSSSLRLWLHALFLPFQSALLVRLNASLVLMKQESFPLLNEAAIRRGSPVGRVLIVARLSLLLPPDGRARQAGRAHDSSVVLFPGGRTCQSLLPRGRC